MDREVIRLTPLEDLALEVLGARHRLGEAIWTFESRHKATLVKLKNRGLVNVYSGVIQRTVRAGLTENGTKFVMSDDYTPPVFKTDTSTGERS